LSALLPALVPSLGQLAAVAALLAVAAGLAAIGAAIRLLAGNRGAIAEADLVVGWGAAVALFVGPGVILPVPFTALAALLAVLALLAIIPVVRHREMPLGPGMPRMAALLVPLLALTASMVASEGDDFSHWLPNLRYLLAVDHFPGVGLPPPDSIFPAYPHGTTLVAYLASRLSGVAADTSVGRFNMLLLASLALAALRLFRGEESGRPGWLASAVALAFVTFLSPTFVPRLALAGYADVSTGVSLAFVALLGLGLVGGNRGQGPAPWLQSALALVALVMTKQSTVALVGLAVVGIAVSTWRRPARLTRLLPALAAAALALAAWRYRVGFLAEGEKTVLPLAEWQWALLPETLRSIGGVIVNKGGYFGAALALCLVALRPPSADAAPGRDLVRVFAAAFVGYTLFLVWIYLAVFTDFESRTAASFWRYHTQLGALQIMALAVVAGPLWRRHGGRLPKALPTALGLVCLAVVVAGPFAALRAVRFDLQPLKLHIAQAMAELRSDWPAGVPPLIVDPQGSGDMCLLAAYHLGLGPRTSSCVYYFTPPDQAAASLGQAKLAYAITTNPQVAALTGLTLPDGASHLIARDESGNWRLARSWPFRGFASASEFKR